MKKLLMLTSILLGVASYAQSDIPVQNISTDDNVRFRLFDTRNTWTFLKLDTATGGIWQVQWSLEGSSYRYETLLSDTDLTPYEEDLQPGRFFLYPTSNIYNFVLLDQVDGRTWQVQWSLEEENRMVTRIY